MAPEIAPLVVGRVYDNLMSTSAEHKRRAYFARPEVRERELKRVRAYREANKEHVDARIRNWRLLKLYGISAADYDALLQRQNGLCAGCGTKPTKKRRLAVDHDHKTKKIRGLLCFNCNVTLGYVRESQTILLALANYLKERS